MVRYVALFRGINVGKAKRLAMADLRALLGKLGYSQVATLLNSGNAVFSATGGTAAAHAGRIREAVSRKLGVDALVIVKSAREIGGIISANALEKIATDPSRLLVAITQDSRALAKVAALADAKWGEERVHFGKHAAYVWCAHGILESRLASALLAKLDETGTTRNWATVNRIHALMGTDGS